MVHNQQQRSWATHVADCPEMMKKQESGFSTFSSNIKQGFLIKTNGGGVMNRKTCLLLCGMVVLILLRFACSVVGPGEDGDPVVARPYRVFG
jgi:hypothetical protein